MTAGATVPHADSNPCNQATNDPSYYVRLFHRLFFRIEHWEDIAIAKVYGLSENCLQYFWDRDQPNEEKVLVEESVFLIILNHRAKHATDACDSAIEKQVQGC